MEILATSMRTVEIVTAVGGVALLIVTIWRIRTLRQRKKRNAQNPD